MAWLLAPLLVSPDALEVKATALGFLFGGPAGGAAVATAIGNRNSAKARLDAANTATEIEKARLEFEQANIEFERARETELLEGQKDSLTNAANLFNTESQKALDALATTTGLSPGGQQALTDLGKSFELLNQFITGADIEGVKADTEQIARQLGALGLSESGVQITEQAAAQTRRTGRREQLALQSTGLQLQRAQAVSGIEERRALTLADLTGRGARFSLPDSQRRGGV